MSPPLRHRRGFSDPGLPFPITGFLSQHTAPIRLQRSEEVVAQMTLRGPDGGAQPHIFAQGAVVQAFCNLIPVLFLWYMTNETGFQEGVLKARLERRFQVMGKGVLGDEELNRMWESHGDFVQDVMDVLEDFWGEGQDQDIAGKTFEEEPRRYTFMFNLLSCRIQDRIRDMLGFNRKNKYFNEHFIAADRSQLSTLTLLNIDHTTPSYQPVWRAEDVFRAGTRSVLYPASSIPNLLTVEEIPIQAIARFCFSATPEENCTLCLTPLSTFPSPELDYAENHTFEAPVQLLNCKHIFGAECLEQWTTANGAKRDVTCPMCRRVLHPAPKRTYSYRSCKYGEGNEAVKFDEDVEYWLNTPLKNEPWGVFCRKLAAPEGMRE